MHREPIMRGGKAYLSERDADEDEAYMPYKSTAYKSVKNTKKPTGQVLGALCEVFEVPLGLLINAGVVVITVFFIVIAVILGAFVAMALIGGGLAAGIHFLG